MTGPLDPWTIGPLNPWTIGPLDYFLDSFWDHFSDHFLDHFFWDYFIGGGRPLVLMEGWDAAHQYSVRGCRRTVVTKGGVEYELSAARGGRLMY